MGRAKTWLWQPTYSSVYTRHTAVMAPSVELWKFTDTTSLNAHHRQRPWKARLIAPWHLFWDIICVWKPSPSKAKTENMNKLGILKYLFHDWTTLIFMARHLHQNLFLSFHIYYFWLAEAGSGVKELFKLASVWLVRPWLNVLCGVKGLSMTAAGWQDCTKWCSGQLTLINYLTFNGKSTMKVI